MKAILEKVDVTEQEQIHAFKYSNSSFELPWHFHPEFELTLILESSGIRYVGNNISDFEAGDLVMLGGNLPHCWKNDKDHSGTSSSLVIQWRKDIISDYPVFNGIKDLLSKSQRGLSFRPDDRDIIIEKMHAVLQSSSLQQYLKLIELLDYIARKSSYDFIAGPSYSYDLSGQSTNRLETVQTYVKEHYREKIRLAHVANHLHMSEQAFSRFFSKTMNKPFFTFLNEYRVNIASRDILETDLQMAEIAYKCGYDSLPFFYKQFKHFKGYTPLEFRKMYRKM